eukprot:8066-Pelagomonas_calceolata.AAC.1
MVTTGFGIQPGILNAQKICDSKRFTIKEVPLPTILSHPLSDCTKCYGIAACEIYRLKWGDLQPDCLADRPVTVPRQST